MEAGVKMFFSYNNVGCPALEEVGGLGKSTLTVFIVCLLCVYCVFIVCLLCVYSLQYALHSKIAVSCKFGFLQFPVSLDSWGLL